MVSLPINDPGDPIAQAPHQGVTPGMIQQQGASVVQGLQGLDQGVQQAANAAAEQAGRDNAANPIITRDANGAIQAVQPQKSFLFNAQAGQAYEQSAMAGTLAQGQAATTVALNNIRQQFDGDPAGFQKASQAYLDNLKAQYGSSPLGMSMMNNAVSMQAQHYNGLVNAKQAQDDADDKANVQAQIAAQKNDMLALARAGATETPAYKAAQAKLAGYYDTLENNERWGLPEQVVANMKRDTEIELQGEAISGHVDRDYGKKDVLQIRKELSDAADALPGASDAQRQYIKSAGDARINFLQGQNQAAIQANQDSLSHLSTMLGTGKAVDSSVWASAADAATKSGDGVSAQRVAALKAQYDGDMAKHGASPSQQAAILTGGPEGNGLGNINISYKGSLFSASNGGVAPAAHYAYLKAQGATDNEALMLTGAAASESGMNPNAPHDSGAGFGLYGHNTGRIDMRGMDWQQQASAALNELRSRPEAAMVNAAKSPGDLAKAQMFFEQPAGFSQSNPEGGHNFTGRLNTLRAFNSLTGGQALPPVGPPSANGNPYTPAQVAANPFLNSAYIAVQARDATVQSQAASQIGQAVQQQLTNGFMPRADVLANYMQLTQGASDTTTLQQREKVQSMVQGKIVSDQAMGMPASQGEAFVNEVMRQAQGGSIFQQHIAQEAQGAYQRGMAQLNSHPAEAALNRGWIPQAPRPLNFDDPHDMAAGMVERSQMMQQIAAREGQGWMNKSVLSGSDASDMENAFKVGTPQQQANIVAAVMRSGMPETQRAATLNAIGATGVAGQVMAKAAVLSDYNENASKQIIAGQSLLADKDGEKWAPKAKEFAGAAEDHLPSSQFPNAKDREMTLNAVKAYYAQSSYQKNDASGTMNDDRFKDAVVAVTGGIAHYNGGKIYPVSYGVSDTTNADIVRSITQDDVKGATLDGHPFEARLLTDPGWLNNSGFRLQSRAPDGTYHIVQGDDARPVMDAGGKPFVLDLKPKLQSFVARINQERTDQSTVNAGLAAPRNAPYDYGSKIIYSGAMVP